MPRIKIISLDLQSLDFDSIIDIFYIDNNNNSAPTFNGYNDDTLELLYFQHNSLCDVINTNTEISTTYSEYIELLNMIDNFNACNSSSIGCIDNGFGLGLCPAYSTQNGVCDAGCNVLFCGWDHGDCNQLCNLSICEPSTSGWGDNTCNLQCNTTQCLWDGYDCIDHTPDKCETEYILCPHYLIGDGWCNRACANDSICGLYEQKLDCLTCDESKDYGCEWAYGYFELVASQDELIDGKEWCQYDELLPILWEAVGWTDAPSCGNLTNNPQFDLNGNEKMGFYEFMLMIVTHYDFDLYNSLTRTDCSLCMQNSSKYYL